MSAARCKSRFRACHHMACMRIVMATHNRSADVTAEPSDVSDRRQRSEGRGLTCRSAPTCHSTRSTTSAVLRAQKSEDRRPVHWDNLPSSFKRSKSSAVSRQVQGSVWTNQRAGKRFSKRQHMENWLLGNIEANGGNTGMRKVIIRVVVCVRRRIVVNSFCDFNIYSLFTLLQVERWTCREQEMPSRELAM